LSVDLTGIFRIGDGTKFYPDFSVLDGQILFVKPDTGFQSFNGLDLFVTDLTAAGTHEIRMLGNSFGVPNFFLTRLGNKVLFAAPEPDEQDAQLWVTDGTARGTKDLTKAYSFATNPADITVLGGKAIFWGHSTGFNRDLWVTDGTSAGTYDYAGFSNVGPDPALTVLGTKALFEVTALSGDSFLWVTDGTFAGTKFLTGNVAGSASEDIVALGKNALFVEYDEDSNRSHLAVTDGTVKGTHELTVAHASARGLFYFNGSPSFQKLGSKVLFAGVDDSGDATVNFAVNLWVTDGTAKGTKELHVANADPDGLLDSRFGVDFTVLGNKVLFVGRDKNRNYNLWITDGTPNGTKELKSLPSGSMFPSNITAIGSRAVFSATDKNGAIDLWVTDGTSKGTRELLVTGTNEFDSATEVAIAGLPPQAPPPSRPTLASASDSGVEGDRITNVTRPTITGRGAAGDTVTLRDGARVIGTAVVGKGGTWSLAPAPALATGVHSLTATEAGAATWTSDASAALRLTIKVSAPAPSGLAFAVAADKVKLGDTIRVAGKGEAGDRVSLFDGAKLVGTAKVGAGGAWSIATAKPLAIGVHSLSASEVDVAGNRSKASPAQSLSLLRAAPNRAVFVGTAGKDQFTGGGGSDVFKFSASALAASDVVKGGAGADYLTLTSAGTVRAGGVAGVETWYLAGAAGNSLTLANANFAGAAGATITIVGGANGNRLSEAAVSAADRAILRGGAGADTLIAGRHATMSGGAGNDRFELTLRGSPATPDRNTIADFRHGADKLGLSETGFGLGAAPKATTLFRANATGAFATTAQRFAYDTATGVLRFDADGKGGGSSPLTIATLTGHPTLSAADLFFFAGASG
jgi:ELWxxDGT repeat protein